MSKFSRFKKMSAINEAATSTREKEFLYRHKSSQIIKHIETDTERVAVLTNSHEEGADEFIMFTEKLEENNIEKGHYIKTVDKDIYLVYNEYKHPQRNLYLKHELLECNHMAKFDGEDVPVYYISSLRGSMDLNKANIGSSTMLSSGENPMIVLSSRPEFKPRFRLTISGETYEMVDLDYKSNVGISYVTVKRAAKRKEDEKFGPVNQPESKEPEMGIMGDVVIDERNTSIGVAAGSIQHTATEQAFVKFNTNVKIIRRAANEIVWEVPWDKKEIKVTTKQGGTEVETTYKVVI